MQSRKTSSEQKISVLGSEVSYHIYHPEQKRTLLMIHGFSGNFRGLGRVIDHLDGFRLIVPDLPGFGASTPMTSKPHTTAGYADFTADFIKALKLAPPIVVGHSFGTVVAAAVAAKHPKLIAEQLILLSPIATPPLAGRDIRYFGARAGELQYWLGRKVHSRFARSRIMSRVMTLLMTKTSDKDLRRKIYAHHFDDLKILRYPEVFYQAYHSINRDGVIHYAPQITQKTLLVTGDIDAVWPKHTHVSLLTELPTAQLVVIPKVGHLAHFESPELVAQAIMKFLA